jgi:microcystin-dependent protein
MTLSLKHAFHSAKGDPADTTLVRPSDWNDEHVIELATGKVIGRATAGTGAAEELAAGTAGLALLATVDSAALLAALAALGIGGFTSGDAKLTLKTTADAGWIMANDGTIGDASSNATTRANADTAALFAVLWDLSAIWVPVLTSAGVASSRGVDAATDFAAHKQIALTKALGRAIAIAGAGSGLTSRTLGQTVGEENHTLSAAELPIVTPTFTGGGGLSVSVTAVNTGAGLPLTDQGLSPTTVTTGNGFRVGGTGVAIVSTGSTSNPTGTVSSFGSGNSHNTMQPTSFWNVMIKL